MPYPNEHAARLLDSDTAHDRVRRTDGSGDGYVQGVQVPDTISVIWYITDGDGDDDIQAQSLRFSVTDWGKKPDKARNWLKNHKIKYVKFEAAKKETQSMADTKYTCECIECGHTLSTNEHCRNIECPECGGEMRRKERPGPGQSLAKKLHTERRTIPRNALTFIGDRKVQFVAAEDETGRDRFQIRANSGGIMEHPYWGNLAVDMDGLSIGKKDKPVLREHDTERIVGWTENIRIDPKLGLIAEGEYSHTTEDGEDVRKLAEEGFPWQASVYVPPSEVEFVKEGETVNVNGLELSGPGAVFRKSVLREVSFCALGADENTSASALSGGGDIDIELNVLSEKEDDMDIAEVTFDQLKERNPDLVKQIEEAAQPDGDELKEKLSAEAVTAERERCADIAKQAASFEMHGKTGELIESGDSVEDAVSKLKFAKSVALQNQDPGDPGANDPDDGAEHDLAGLEGEEKFKAEWEQDTNKCRSEFSDEKAYFAYRKAEEGGQVKIYDKKG